MLIKQLKVFRDLVGQDEADKEERINKFLGKYKDDIDEIKSYVTSDGEIVVIITYYLGDKNVEASG